MRRALLCVILIITSVAVFATVYSYPVSTIIIDAGHGGVDPGAVGIDNLFEKDVTLALSLRLKENIEKNSDIRVILTRSDDTFIRLEDRVALSNSTFPGWNKSALFISIHVNGSTSSTSSGFEILVRESNKSAPFISTVSEDWAVSYFSHTSFTQLRRALNQASYGIAHSIRTALSHSFPDSRDRGIKEMDVYVLHNNIWPSVLIEAGFITNQEEASLMKTSSWLDELSQSIWEGILQYTL